MAHSIYKITNKLNGLVYIGKTKHCIFDRFKQHIYSSTKDEINYFHNALNKYGIENFSIEIIVANIPNYLSNPFERYWINFYNSFGEGGYNLTPGGDGGCGRKLSEETKLKISKSVTISHALRGVKGVDNPNFGQKRTEIQKDKFRGSLNPAAIVVQIFDSNDKLRFESNGNIEQLCLEENLPKNAILDSYRYSKKIFQKSRKCDINRINSIYGENTYEKFVGWYAIKC